jgi:hypothetical protein
MRASYKTYERPSTACPDFSSIGNPIEVVFFSGVHSQPRLSFRDGNVAAPLRNYSAFVAAEH